MKKHPEYMILIAVGVALLAAIIASCVSCSMLSSAVSNAGNHQGAPGGNIPFEIPEDNGGSNNGAPDDNGNPGGSGQLTVPETMEIEVAELQDDLGAVINNDITRKLGLSDADKVTVSNLTKDTVGKPEQKGAHVLSQVSGKVTITNKLGQDETVGYTSYYYADNPAAEKVTWYIYAYDLDSYDVLPKGFKEIAGDPMDVREILQSDLSGVNGLLGIGDTEKTTTA